ncbi:OmpA family protein [Actinomyces bowdenii]|nr:OmpA family protein [Actinomyces bowdenii]
MSAPGIRRAHRGLLRGAGTLAALGVVLSGMVGPAWADDESSEDPKGGVATRTSGSVTHPPAVIGEAIPPASVRPDIAPVRQIVMPRMDLVLRVGASDGAVTTDSDGTRTRATLSGDVNFETDSATLTDRAKQVLDEIVSGWGGTPPESVAVVGHTDSVADDAHNQTLSEQRAQAVADYLTSKAPSVKVEVSGKGESEPVASETKEDGSVSEEGRAANRRVEITWQQ